MRIGIYTYHIKVGKSGGVQQYSTRLIHALVKLTKNDIYVFTNKQLANTDYIGLKKNNNYHEIIFPQKTKFYLKIFFNNRLIIITPIPFIINRIHSKKFFNFLFKVLGDIRCIIYSYKIDLLHIPSQSLPAYHWKIPTLISLHDLQHKYFPEFFTDKVIHIRDYHYKRSCKECYQIIVSFNHVKEDIIHFYGIEPEKITVTFVGYDYESADIVHKDKDVFEKFRIPHDFLLYPAQTWKHKNHIFLLNVIARYIKKYDKNIYLVCTGVKGNYYKNIEKVIFKKNLKSNVKFIGFVSEEELDVLYNKTKLVVVPTLYEAGCYPIIEAMSRGVPVIGSNVTSIPEIIGDKRFIFNPKNEVETCYLINKMIKDKKFRNENILNSKRQIKKFEWSSIIKNYLCAYKNAIVNYNSK